MGLNSDVYSVNLKVTRRQETIAGVLFDGVLADDDGTPGRILFKFIKLVRSSDKVH